MTIDQQTIVQYLLGELSEKQENEIEENYFEDSALFAQVANAEDELIHQYLNDRLEPYDRELFERNILSLPEKRKKVEFMKGLIEFAPDEEKESLFATIWMNVVFRLNKLTDFMTQRTWILRLAPAFAVLFLAIISIKLNHEIGGLQTQLSQQQEEKSTLQQQTQELQQQVEQQSQRNVQLSQQLQQEENQRAELEKQVQARSSGKSELVEVDLYTTIALKSSRSENTLESTQIKRDGQVFKLKLYLEDDTPYQGYHINLETVAGDTLWSQFQKVAAQDGWPVLYFLVPANILAQNDYIIQVSGKNSANEWVILGSYPLRILVK